MRHAISKVASILNISPSLIRHYEKKGILSCTRTGSYRSFENSDYMVLQRCQMYRKLEMGLDDIARLINVDSPEAFSAQMDKSIAVLQRDIELRQMIIRCVQRQKSQIERIPDHLDTCWVETIPAFRAQNAVEYKQPAKKLTNYWFGAEYTPFAEASLCIRNFGAEDKEEKNYVITIFDEFAQILELSKDTRAQRIPEQRCLCSIIKSDPNAYLRPEQIDFMLDYGKTHHIKRNDTVYIRYLNIVKTPEGDGYDCYLEVWIPISPDD